MYVFVLNDAKCIAYLTQQRIVRKMPIEFPQ